MVERCLLLPLQPYGVLLLLLQEVYSLCLCLYICARRRWKCIGFKSDCNLIAIGCTTKAVFSLFFGSIFTLHPLIHRSALGETPHKFQ